LDSLDAQTYQDFEVLIIDGNENPSPARVTVQQFLAQSMMGVKLNLIASGKGLTRQRNVGLGRAKGELICFLDDDVTVPPDFLSRVVNILGQPEMQDVGGMTGYDKINYPAPVTLRWRLRRMFGVIPDLPPGGIDHLGRGIPLSFLQPFTGYKEVGLLAGFCMIFRRSTVGALRFDELIPTYGGEDRDFSMQVGWRSRLLICGDLLLCHYATPQGRDSDLERNVQSAFGMGRRFVKFSRSRRDDLTLIATFLADCAIDLMFLVRRPAPINFRITVGRIMGFFAGLRSAAPEVPPPAVLSGIDSSKPQSDRVSSLP
jgi:glycosyltransferase involved in cell wall biosynthesis